MFSWPDAQSPLYMYVKDWSISQSPPLQDGQYIIIYGNGWQSWLV
jgi:hypothetical protein